MARTRAPRKAARKAPKTSPKRPARTPAPARNPARKAPVPRAAAPGTRKPPRLEDVAETLAVMMPALAARLAALEHSLVEAKLATHKDLRRARAFVDMRRSDA